MFSSRSVKAVAFFSCIQVQLSKDLVNLPNIELHIAELFRAQPLFYFPNILGWVFNNDQFDFFVDGQRLFVDFRLFIGRFRVGAFCLPFLLRRLGRVEHGDFSGA